MLLSILAATAALSGPQAAAPAAPIAAPAETIAAEAVLIDCQVAQTGLTDCKAIDAEGAKAERAIQLAAQIEVPEGFALANPGRIRIKLNLN